LRQNLKVFLTLFSFHFARKSKEIGCGEENVLVYLIWKKHSFPK